MNLPIQRTVNKHPKFDNNFDIRRQLEHFEYEMNRTLILQPDEPYVSYIGSNGDYNPFVYQAGISSMDIRFMGGPESMQNLSMVFPTRFTSKQKENRFLRKLGR